jgi:hypothetical protein
MEIGSSSDGNGGSFSNEELHEHGDQWRMVENQ